MKTAPHVRSPRSVLGLGIAFASFACAVFAQPVNWTGGANGTNSNMNLAGNWSTGALPDDASEVRIAEANGTGSLPNTLTLQGNINMSLRSFLFDNSEGRYGSNGLRIAATTGTSSSNQSTIYFNTAGTIITALNNAAVAFRSASLSNPSTADPAPSLTLNLNYSGFGVVDIDASSIVRVDEASGGVPAATVIGTGGIEKRGEGVLRFQGGHSYAGGFTLSEGIFEYTASGSTSGGALVSSPFGLGTARFNGGTLRSTTDNERTIYNDVELNGTVTITTDVEDRGGAFLVSTSAGGATSILSNSTLNIARTVTWNQAISGNDRGLTKTGGGTLVLNGANTYTGNTGVMAGTLELNGSIAGDLTVASGALLRGRGTVGGNASIAGMHSPGNSPGIQTFEGNLFYQAGAEVIWELSANLSLQGSPNAVFDQIIVGGTLDFAGPTQLSLSFDGTGSSVNWNDAFWQFERSWTIYEAAAVSNVGNLSIEVANWLDASGNAFDDILSGWQFSLVQTGDRIQLHYAAIPEPSAYAMAIGSLATLVVFLRRRRSAA